MPVKPIPDGYHTATPYLIVKGGASALEFYAEAFGAIETMRMPGAEGMIGHAEIRVGNSVIMLSDGCSVQGRVDPLSLGGSPVGILLYVEDVDAFVARATAAGATLTSPVVDQFYGDRMGTLSDPFGHVWYVATHVEDVSPEEMKSRMAAMVPQPA